VPECSIAFSCGCRYFASSAFALNRIAISIFGLTAIRAMPSIGLQPNSSKSARKSLVILFGVPFERPERSGFGVPFLNGMLLACYLRLWIRCNVLKV
jgi:hypothetical protein